MGGTDGSLLTSDVFEVNLSSKDKPFAERLKTDFEFSTGMGHLIYRKDANELHHIGGINSEAVNYSLKLDKQPLRWEASKFNFTYVMSEKDDELTQWPSVYFA